MKRIAALCLTFLLLASCSVAADPTITAAPNTASLTEPSIYWITTAPEATASQENTFASEAASSLPQAETSQAAVRTAETGATVTTEKSQTANKPTVTTKKATVTPGVKNEIRAVWLSYFDLKSPAGGLSEQAWRKKYAALFDKYKRYGLNTLFIHVRPYTDAIYPSALYPWSDILTGTQGKNPGYDPLKILCSLASERGLAVHAWLNPFRILPDNTELSELAKNNPALPHIEAKDQWVREVSGRYYWNPAYTESQALVFKGVRELLENYPLVGIHIDDYFYPTQAASFDAAQYNAYKENGGALPLGDWRREVISQFVSGLYRTVHNARSGAVLSISPAGDMKSNYNREYADIARWMREAGYADWIVPQVYFGFKHPKFPFEATAHSWAQLPKHTDLRLVYGLAAYKVGADDKYAGETARGEWKENSDIIARQVKIIRGLKGCAGFALYSSAAFFNNNLSDTAEKERDNLQLLLN